MGAINEIVDKHGLIVIEDAAQAPGAQYKGQKVGTIGHMGTFSLNQTKNLSGGEGGLFVTDSVEYYKKAQGICMFGEEIRAGEPRGYIAYSMGWNYRTQELSAAFARSQLRRLDYYNEKAQENVEILTSALRNIKGIKPPYKPSGSTTHIYHKYRVRLRPKELGFNRIDPRGFRNKVAIALEAEGVSITLWYTFPLPANPLFQEKEGYSKGCPWTCPHARKSIEYTVAD